jgi:hypothetical protein
VPERIECGKPEQNGRHERMHLTLKHETALRPESTLPRQQTAFDRFRREYNDERPHEALDQKPPATVYTPSPRPYPKRLPWLEYPSTTAIRRVLADGTFGWRGQRVFLSELLEHQDVGLDEIDDDLWSVRFGPIELGLLDGRGTVFQGSGGFPPGVSTLRINGRKRGNNGPRNV